MPLCAWGSRQCDRTRWSWVCGLTLYYCQAFVFARVLAANPGINVYDIRKTCEGPLCYDFSAADAFLNSEAVRAALGVPQDVAWSECNMAVHAAFTGEGARRGPTVVCPERETTRRRAEKRQKTTATGGITRRKRKNGKPAHHKSRRPKNTISTGDFMRDFSPKLVPLLEDNVPVMIYAGDKDLICNHVGNRRWVDSLEWSGAAAWRQAADRDWSLPGASGASGSVATSGPLSFVRVFDAGHMVPMDQPEAALHMISRFVSGTALVRDEAGGDEAGGSGGGEEGDKSGGSRTAAAAPLAAAAAAERVAPA